MFKKILKTIANVIIAAVKVTIRIATGVEVTKAKEMVPLPATVGECDWKLLFSKGYRASDVPLSKFIIGTAGEARIGALFLFFSVIFATFVGVVVATAITGFYPGIIANLAITTVTWLGIAGVISRAVIIFAKFRIKSAF